MRPAWEGAVVCGESSFPTPDLDCLERKAWTQGADRCRSGQK